MQRNKLQPRLPFSITDKGHVTHKFYHKIKLSLLFVFPLLIFISSATFQIDKLTTRTLQLANMDELTNLTVKISHLLHNLQKERGYSGVYITSDGTQFKTELLAQRRLVEASNKVVHQLLTQINFITNIKFENRVASFNQYFVELDNIRLQVDNLAIDDSTAIKFYNQLNHQLLDVLTSIVQLTVDSKVTQAFSAYTLFLRGKESVAMERVQFGVVLTRGYFSNNEHSELVKLDLEQNIFFHEFSEYISNELLQDFEKINSEQAIASIHEIKSRALNNNNTEINVSDWFNVMTNKIDKLNLLGDKISVELISNVSQLKQKSEQERNYWLVALISLFIVISVSGIWLIIHINRTAISRIKEYQDLFSKNSAAMAVIDGCTKKILYGNQSFAELIGYSQQTLPKLNISDFHRKRDIKDLLSIFNKMMRGEISVTEKVLFIRHDGTVFFADIFGFPITIENKECLAAHVVDITNKLQAQQQIHQSELTLKTVLNSLTSAVAVFEYKNQIPIYMNKKANQIYQKRNEVEPVWSFFEQENVSCSKDELTNNPTIKEHYFNKSKQRCYQITTNLIDWSDGRTVCLKMLKDITENCDAEYRNKNLLTENRQLLCRNFLLIEEERKHIAKELHDELGQLLTGIKLQADFIFRQTEDNHKVLQASAKNIVQVANQLIQSTRDITNNLRPITLDQLGLIDAIKELVQNWRTLNNHIHFDLETESLPCDLSDETQISIYRIVQEGITNACKHAEAKNIKIVLKFIVSTLDDDRYILQLKIQDDGKGLVQTDALNHGVGIINMRERTEALYGTFCLIDRQNQGTELLIILPLTPLLQEEALCH